MTDTTIERLVRMLDEEREKRRQDAEAAGKLLMQVQNDRANTGAKALSLQIRLDEQAATIKTLRSDAEQWEDNVKAWIAYTDKLKTLIDPRRCAKLGPAPGYPSCHIPF